MAEQHSQPVPGGVSGPTGGSMGAAAVTRRPGMLTFAAVMMFGLVVLFKRDLIFIVLCLILDLR